MQQGDVEKNLCEYKFFKKISNFKPDTKIEKGLEKFIDWFISVDPKLLFKKI